MNEPKPSTAARAEMIELTVDKRRRQRMATAAELRARPEICGLCGGWSRGTQLQFSHPREQDHVSLELHLCRNCGDRIEKHLKRAIPRRAMDVTPLEPDAAA
jgi:hypothetical protein